MAGKNYPGIHIMKPYCRQRHHLAGMSVVVMAVGFQRTCHSLVVRPLSSASRRISDTLRTPSLPYAVPACSSIPRHRARIRSRRRSPTTQLHVMVPPDLSDLWHHHDTFSSVLVAAQTVGSNLNDAFDQLPFQDMAKRLASSLDIGGSLTGNQAAMYENWPERTTTMVMDSIGRDVLVFLAASVIVTPWARAMKISPILGYLLAGAALGPFGLDMFSNTEADVELGDFGILFLLFSEGLEVSSARWSQLTKYLPLGLAQMSLTTGILTAALLLGFPEFLDHVLPASLDIPVTVHRPVEAVILAITGTLSTSAFIFPVLKERGWEEEPTGEAATSILLLQDLAVAPLLVFLPYLVGTDTTDYGAIAFLTAKATIGFGAVIAIGSYALRQLFALVSQTRSAETFVALCLLASAGMGTVAKMLGLTDTAGAFAAGVLLANTNYRAQIQADILPFKGILLGIFFMGAGSNFDTGLAMQQYPTIIFGALFLIIFKAITLFAATKVPRWMEPNRLPTADAARLALLLSGGGEFAFVVMALASELGVIPNDLNGTLTAIVLITMGVTPLLGDLAENVSARLLLDQVNQREYDEIPNGATPAATDAIVVCGCGEVGQGVLTRLCNGLIAAKRSEDQPFNLPRVVAFDNNPTKLKKLELEDVAETTLERIVLYGDCSNPEVLRTGGISEPAAIFITFRDYDRVFSAVARLHAAFPVSPIFTRAQTTDEATSLKAIGATDVVVEANELPRAATRLLESVYSNVDKDNDWTNAELRMVEARMAGLSEREVDQLLQLYASMDLEGTGLVTIKEVLAELEKSNYRVATDEVLKEMEDWLVRKVDNKDGFIDSLEFCRLYAAAPEAIRESFGLLQP